MNIAKIAAVLMIGAAEALADEAARQIIVSIPDRKLVLLEAGRVKKVYDIAVGKASTPSPTGTFHIASRVKNPTWYGPKVVVPPGKGNPLGTRWMVSVATRTSYNVSSAPDSRAAPIAAHIHSHRVGPGVR